MNYKQKERVYFRMIQDQPVTSSCKSESNRLFVTSLLTIALSWNRFRCYIVEVPLSAFFKHEPSKTVPNENSLAYISHKNTKKSNGQQRGAAMHRKAKR